MSFSTRLFFSHHIIKLDNIFYKFYTLFVRLAKKQEVIMPSGSHGGSRGSHSSGGARSSGGSRGGYSSGRNRTRVFIIGGVRYGLPATWNSRYNLLSNILSFVVFFLFFSIIMITGSASNIENIKTDYLYYDNMIATAEVDSRYITEGKIIDKSLGEGGKWFFDYTFVADDGELVYGYTYSIYTFEEIQEFSIGQTILLATNAISTTSWTDSIPMVCKGVSYEVDGDYIEAHNMQTYGIVFTCLLGASVVGIIVARVVIVKKHKTISPQEEKSLEAFSKKVRRCAYCGSILLDYENKCASCGAKREEEHS